MADNSLLKRFEGMFLNHPYWRNWAHEVITDLSSRGIVTPGTTSSEDITREILYPYLSKAGQPMLGRDLTKGEMNKLLQVQSDDLGSEILSDGIASPESLKKFIGTVTQQENGREIVKELMRPRLNELTKEQFGIDDSSTLINDDDLEGIVASGDITKFNEDIGTKISSLISAKNFNLLSTFDTEFKKVTGREPTQEEQDAFLDDHKNDSLGLEGIGETEFRAIRDALNDMTASIAEEVGSSEAAQEAAAADQAPAGLTREEIETKLSEAQDTFAQELASRRGPLEERLSTAITEFESTIPERAEQFRGILQERFEESIPELQRSLGEEFTAGVGLKSGAFQQVLGEELAAGQTDIERDVTLQQLAQQQEVDRMRLGLQEQLGQLEAGDVERVAGLGLAGQQTGAQIGREDFLSELDFQRNLQLAAQQRDISMFLNRLGFAQQQAAQQQQQSFQLGMLGREQSFAAQQNALNRQLQRETFQRQLQEQRRQEKRARRQQQAGLLTSLAGAGIGALTGGLGAGLIGGGLTGTQGALIGAGVAGGFPGLTYAGLFGGGSGGGYNTPYYSGSTPPPGYAQNIQDFGLRR